MEQKSENNLIPPHYRNPQKGDLYESAKDQEIEFLTAWHAAITGDGTATLFKGERIWIDEEPIDEKPVGVYALPVNYSELETRMVPENQRNHKFPTIIPPIVRTGFIKT